MTTLDGAVFASGFQGGGLSGPKVRQIDEQKQAASCGMRRDAGPSGRGNQPKIAFARWLYDHPGKKPADFQPLIREAEFAYRCRAAFVPACDDLGGARATERQLRNLELGLCGGWRALAQSEARSLADWLDAVLPHHPWGAVLDWRESGAQRALADYCQEDAPRATAATDARARIAEAGLADTFDQACSFNTWRDVQSLVLSAWLGGALLVDECGFLVADWKETFAVVLASRAEALG